jgi:hypothetical protein
VGVAYFDLIFPLRHRVSLPFHQRRSKWRQWDPPCESERTAGQSLLSDPRGRWSLRYPSVVASLQDPLASEQGTDAAARKPFRSCFQTVNRRGRDRTNRRLHRRRQIDRRTGYEALGSALTNSRSCGACPGNACGGDVTGTVR